MSTVLKDAEARRLALVERERSLLVEAGAGSGKTALMAGRVALLLADGIEPRQIAAITFTELAAAELAERIRSLSARLLDGEVPVEVAVALPDGLSPERRAGLQRGIDKLDDLTATTIHGFALDLIRPYPAEADMDPGATPMDAAEAALLFDDEFEGWLRERLSRRDDGSDVVVQLALVQAGDGAVEWLRQLARKVTEHPEAHAPAASRESEGADGGAPDAVADAFARFAAAIDTFADTVGSSFEPPAGTGEHLRALQHLKTAWAAYESKPLRLAAQVAYERPYPPFTKAGTLRKSPGTKKAWLEAARAIGQSKADAERSWDACKSAYEDVCSAFEALDEASANTILGAAIEALREMHGRYAKRKRDGALLDFDDLLTLAVRMPDSHPEVLDALAERYRFVLVDEFQDTDPRQAEIIWRLTGQPRPGVPWSEWPCRGPSRFVVGDPKQSIYRFRRADVDTYVDLRSRMREDTNGFELSITTNFRSVPGILSATNAIFEEVLSAEGQPGYTALGAHRVDPGVPAIARLELPLPDGADPQKGPSAGVAREQEAVAVARLCARLMRGDPELPIGPVRANQIALLAPAGTELWRYERELERLGIPVASQAGKGFYQRQEVQDLVALSRALADTSDTAALGALLRGPLVGASEERLLDVAEALYQADAPRLSLRTDPELVPDDGIRRVLERLAPLARGALARTPYQTISASLEQLEVRALVRQRHAGRAERALANVERFLESTRPWAVRGLRAFAQDAYARWQDDERTLEGRPEAEEGSVTLVTVHSAKGLEWDVVVPINMMSKPGGVKPPFVERSRGQLWHTVGKATPSGWEDAKAREAAAESAEHVRLLYVAATRARDLLVVPEPAWPLDPNCWLALAGLDQVEGQRVPLMAVEAFPGESARGGAQDAETFREEAERIREATPVVNWSAPSRHDAVDGRSHAEVVGFDDDVVGGGGPTGAGDLDAADLDGENAPVTSVEASTSPAPADGVDSAAAVEPISGRGRLRGLILHPLMEQLITGEVHEEGLEVLAAELTEVLFSSDRLEDGDAYTGRPDPVELAAAARRGWNSSEVAAVRADLLAELDVYGHTRSGEALNLVAGVTDAVAVDAKGKRYLVIDWKSDVEPTDATIAAYCEQVREYLRLTGVERGLVVFLTSGRTIEVSSVISAAHDKRGPRTR